MAKWKTAKKTTTALKPKAVKSSSKDVYTPKDHLFRGKEPSKWSPYKNGISPTSFQLWLSCREQFRIQYVLGLRPWQPRMGLEFGNCCHYLLENARRLPKPPDAKWVKAMVAKYAVDFQKEHKLLGDKNLETMDYVYGYAESVIPVYFKRYAGDWKGCKYPSGHANMRIGGRWQGVESKFRVPYVFPDGKIIPIQGRRDAVFSAEGGGLYNFDTKCYSQYNAQDLLAVLPVDVQQMMYAWATMQELKKMVQGLTLDVIRRPGQRKKQGEPRKKFFERVTAEVSNQANWDHYFYRPEVNLVPEDFKKFKERFFDPAMMDFRSWWEGGNAWCGGIVPHYMNPGALINKYGRCDCFETLTTGGGMDLQYASSMDPDDYP